MKSIQYTLLALALLHGLTARAACEGSQNLPSEQVHLPFKFNDASVSEAEREKLRRWISLINSNHAIQNWITIVGSAASSERTPKDLAMRRAVTVARDALEDGLVNAPLQIKTQIYPTASSEPVSSDSREVTVEMSPGCPKDCCDGQ